MPETVETGRTDVAGRPLPSERMDAMEAAQKRLKAEATAAAEKPKRTKAPTYYVLVAETDEHEGLWALLGTGPVSASSRQEAIRLAVAERGDPIDIPPEGRVEEYATVLADHWVTTTRTLKPPPETAYVEEWS